MTISADATAKPIPRLGGGYAFVDPQSGYLMEFGSEGLDAWRNFIVGMNRVTPCNASGTNVVTLTPLTASPLIEKYTSFDAYAFTAENTSSGLVTMTVMPRKGTLATLKAYKTNGSAQATAGDLVSGLFYVAYYVDTMDGGAGGFVLK